MERIKEIRGRRRRNAKEGDEKGNEREVKRKTGGSD